MNIHSVYLKSPVGLLQSRENSMVITGLNYKLIATDNGFKIDALVKKNGKQFRRRETIEGGRRVAEKRAQQIVRELEVKSLEVLIPIHEIRSLKTFSECVSYYEKNTLTNTENNKYHLEMVRKFLGDATVEDEDIFQRRYTAFIGEMRRTISKYGKPFSPTTINHFTRRVDAVLNFCKRKKAISKTFSYDHDKFPQKPRKRVIDGNEKEMLLKTIKQERPYLLPIVLYSMQIPSRKSELVQMRRDWVDLEQSCIVIPMGITKNGEECIKPIPPNMIDYFRSIPNDSEFVFYREEDGKYKSLGDFKKSWTHCRNKAGIDNLRFHDTRHHSATNLVNNGVPERVVMQVAGWKTNMLTVYYDNKSTTAASLVFDVLKSMKVSPEVSP